MNAAQSVAGWFRNRKADWRKGKPLDSSESEGEAQASKKRGSASSQNASRRLVRQFLEPIRGRAPSAAILWSRATEGIASSKAFDNIGGWRRHLKERFAQLPANEQAAWREKAKNHKKTYQLNPEQCYE